jgi:predicted signal transduction protein with EAL and GGDEF domain
MERLERELKTAEGFGRPVSVLLIDIDHMKEINAKHGQRVGDQVLTEFGRFLSLRRGPATCPPESTGTASRSSCQTPRTTAPTS